MSTTKETYRARAARQYGLEEDITGEGRYAVLLRCGDLQVALFPSLEDALNIRQYIDHRGCGGACKGRPAHEVIDLDDLEKLQPWNFATHGKICLNSKSS